MDRKNQTPQGQIAEVVVEYLEVAVSCIVFQGFYPPRAFERRRYMNVVVQKALHPELTSYIHSVTISLLPFIQKGFVERVVVIFYDKGHVPIEKFVFKLAVNQSYSSKLEEADLEHNSITGTCACATLLCAFFVSSSHHCVRQMDIICARGFGDACATT